MSKKFEIYMQVQSDETKEKCLANIAKFDAFNVVPTNPYDCNIYILEIDDIGADLHVELNKIFDINNDLDIYIISKEESSSKILELINAGIRAYWTRPLADEKIMNALEKFLKRHALQPSESEKENLGISLLGVKGGVGTTTLAVNIAAILQKLENKDPVLLIDLKQPHGDCNVLLNMTPTHDLGTLIHESDRLDTTFFLQVLTRHDCGLYLLPPIKKFEDFPFMTPEVMSNILAHAYNSFTSIVFDQGSTLNDTKLKYLYSSDYVLLVCQQDLQNIRNVKIIYDFLVNFDKAFENKIKIIVNRYDKNSLLDRETMAEALGLEIYWTIPSDYKLLNKCCDSGSLLCELSPRSDLHQSLLGLTESLAPRPSPVENGGTRFIANLLSSIFKSR